MRFERITNTTHMMFSKALDLYQSSFPPHEQRESPSQEQILSNSDYNFTLIYDEDAFVGLVLYWEKESFIYIEHLCISPEIRNKGYGKKTLTALKENHKTIILEIDPPIDTVSKRRKGFYERCGFAENPYRHIHPPYHRDNDGH